MNETVISTAWTSASLTRPSPMRFSWQWRMVRQRSLNSRIYILMLSALDSDAEMREDLAAGADVYLGKGAS